MFRDQTVSWKNRSTSLYKRIKSNFISESYVYSINNKRNRSPISRSGAWCLDLEIETGRWRDVNKDERICTHCNDEIENEIRFCFTIVNHLLSRKLYSDDNYFEKDGQNENSHFALFCTENKVLRTSKCTRHLYDERKIFYTEINQIYQYYST